MKQLESTKKVSGGLIALSNISSIPERWKNNKLATIDQNHKNQTAAVIKQAKMMQREANLFAMLLNGSDTDRNAISNMKILTNQDIAIETCRLNQWVKEIGFESTMAVVCEAIDFYRPLFREKRWLTEDQIQYIGNHILNHYQITLGIGEIMYLMNQGLLGRWGKIYDGLDAEDILRWIGMYIETQSLKLESDHTDRKQVQAPVYDSINDMVKTKLNKWNAKEPKAFNQQIFNNPDSYLPSKEDSAKYFGRKTT